MLLNLILFISISCKDHYESLSSDAQDLFLYREGESFVLLNTVTRDTILFEITEYENVFLKDYSPYQYYQYLKVVFRSDDGFSGYIFNEGGDDFPVEFAFAKDDVYSFKGELIDTLFNHTLHDNEYDELYVFSEEKGKKPMLYYTKEEGIVYIDSLLDGSSYSLIEYVKAEGSLE